MYLFQNNIALFKSFSIRYRGGVHGADHLLIVCNGGDEDQTEAGTGVVVGGNVDTGIGGRTGMI